MRSFTLFAGVVIFVIGFVLQYGAWLAAWLGRLFGLHTPASTYTEFVEGVTATMAGHGFMRIVFPWLLMAVGLTLIALCRYVRGRNEGRP